MGGGDYICPSCAMARGSETAIEINIKTMDSQTYTFKVDKQMAVPALKEHIAFVTDVPSDQQRLIFCGRVLEDDQLLSAYHVEDGHTLHLVVRQSIPPAAEATDTASITDGAHRRHRTIIGNFRLSIQGDSVSSEISRTLPSLLRRSLDGAIARGYFQPRPEVYIIRGWLRITQNANREERGVAQQVSGQRNSQSGSGGENTETQTTSRSLVASYFTEEPGSLVVPVMTVIASFLAVLANVNARRGSQLSAENQHASVNDLQSTSETDPMHQDSEYRTREGHSIDAYILPRNDLEFERWLSNVLRNYLRSFPGAEIEVHVDSLRGQAADSASETVGTSTASVESEITVTDGGMLLPNSLRETMPSILQDGGAEPNDTPPGEAHASDHQRAQHSSGRAERYCVRRSHRRSNNDTSSPNSKRRRGL